MSLRRIASAALFFALIPALLLGSPPSSAQSASPRPQFRGMWVTAWGHGLKSPVEVDHLIQAAQTAHLNALLVQVRKRGDSYYFSSMEPLATDIVPNFDPLADVLNKAHAVGIQVHAWFVVMPAWSERRFPPPPGHVLYNHPDWATRNKDGHRMTTAARDTDEGIFLDPGIPEVQTYLASVARDLVEKYPVDGLHLDYIRYPGRQWGYHPIAVRRFKDETGTTPTASPSRWDQWRRDQVTAIVARIAREVQEARPSVQLSAAVFPSHEDSFIYRLQDWEKWRKEGLVDFVVPMNYATTRARFASRSRALLSRGGGRPVYMGVGGGNKSEAATLEQMEMLKKSNVPGIVLYHYDGNSPQFWVRVRNRLYPREALTPDLPWKPKP